MKSNPELANLSSSLSWFKLCLLTHQILLVSPPPLSSFLDKELQALRGENRKNMLLSVALLVLSALFYYIFLHSDDESTQLD